MRQKELRIALVCYGGVSLAVYMHGVTKELWKLARASRAFHGQVECREGSEQVYCRLLAHLQSEHQLRLKVMPDILTGASAGGINAVFLAQAIHSGQSLEPLTELWLSTADVEVLLDHETSWISRVAKAWAAPFVRLLLMRPGNAVSQSVAPETRIEVRRKLSRFVRGRWFNPPFSGPGFSHLLADALDAMAEQPPEQPLLPPDHPVDLYVTATDFNGHVEMLQLHSPRVVEETEHRMSIHFRALTPAEGGRPLAPRMELVLATRATASFPGAFPPLTIAEMDEVAKARGDYWPGRDGFLARVMPEHVRAGTLDRVALIDGSVLVNAPFDSAIAALKGRPAHREVDRRFVYIDPRPEKTGLFARNPDRPVGFFAALFGSLSTIPREQPIRDNLEALADKSREAERLQLIIQSLRPAVEETVEQLFGNTLFLDRPTPRRLSGWRKRAQQTAAEKAGFAYHAYAHGKFNGIIQRLARIIHRAAPQLRLADQEPIAAHLRDHLLAHGLDRLSAPRGGASPQAILFFRDHDIAFRIRRLRLLARRVARDWEELPGVAEHHRDSARAVIYDCLSAYFEREGGEGLGDDFAVVAAGVMRDPGAVLKLMASRRALAEVDRQVEAKLAGGLEGMPRALRRRLLLAYLGFPFFDITSLPLLPDEGMSEFDAVKVDRISPEDCHSIRKGGAAATLRGTEFYNFGAFFSRAYRENDYLWGRLHGAERMIDLVISTVQTPPPPRVIARFKQDTFLAILNEEQARLQADPALVSRIRREVLERRAGG